MVRSAKSVCNCFTSTPSKPLSVSSASSSWLRSVFLAISASSYLALLTYSPLFRSISFTCLSLFSGFSLYPLMRFTNSSYLSPSTAFKKSIFFPFHCVFVFICGVFRPQYVVYISVRKRALVYMTSRSKLYKNKTHTPASQREISGSPPF